MSILLNNRLAILQKSIFAPSQSQFFRNLSYLVSILFFLLGGFLFFLRIFIFLEGVELIGPFLSMRILSLAFLVFFTMLFLSNIISALSTFFHSREVEFFMSTPIKPSQIFTTKFIENIFYSSWATVIAGIPLLFAFGASRDSPPSFYPLSLIVLFLFLTIPSSLGLLSLFLLLRAFPRLKKGAVLLISLGSLLLTGMLYLVGKPSTFKIPFTANLSELDSYLNSLGAASSPYLINTWLANLISSASSGETSQSLFFFLLILSTGLFFTLLAGGVGQKFYRSLWLFRSSESGGRKREDRSLEMPNFALQIPHSPMRSLIWKDLVIFLRDPTQWTQALILLGLLVVYIISLHRTPIYFKDPFWRTIVSFINLGFTGYVFATLSIRFIYPTISLEGLSFWILKTSPLSIREIFFSKLIVNLLIGIFLVESLVILSNLLLDVGIVLTLFSSIVVLFFALSLVSISMGFGAILPDLRERNPSKIASGPGGLLTALLSLTYIALSASVLAWPVYLHLLDPLTFRPEKARIFLLSGGIFLLLNLFTILFPLRLGIRALKRREL